MTSTSYDRTGLVVRRFAEYLYVFAGLLAAVPAAAQEAGPRAGFGPDAVGAVERYLDELPTVRAQFTQANADGSIDHGSMWLWRPGLARVEYAPPTDLLLVADGTWLIYFDAELDQVSHIPIDAGPFRFLLAEEVDLAGDVRATRVERGGGVLRLTLEDPEAPGDGSVTLVFDESPIALRQWEVVDAQGYRTVVTLHDTVLGERFERGWFRFPESARKRDFRLGAHR